MNTATIAVDDAVAHVTFREDIDEFLAAFARDGETAREAEERDDQSADENDAVLFHQYLDEQLAAPNEPAWFNDAAAILWPVA